MYKKIGLNKAVSLKKSCMNKKYYQLEEPFTNKNNDNDRCRVYTKRELQHFLGVVKFHG